MVGCYCCFSKPQSDDEGEDGLSAEEIAVLQTTWQTAVKVSEDMVGRKIVMSLVAQKPKYGRYFGVPEGVAPEKLGDFQEVIAQGMRIQRFIDTLVKGLKPYSTETILHLAKSVGVIHFHRGVNFEADTWILLKSQVAAEVIEYNIQSTEMNRLVNNLRRASRTTPQTEYLKTLRNSCVELDPSVTNEVIQGVWAKFLSMVVREMKRGFLEETLRQCQNVQEEPNTGSKQRPRNDAADDTTTDSGMPPPSQRPPMDENRQKMLKRRATIREMIRNNMERHGVRDDDTDSATTADRELGAGASAGNDGAVAQPETPITKQPQAQLLGSQHPSRLMSSRWNTVRCMIDHRLSAKQQQPSPIEAVVDGLMRGQGFGKHQRHAIDELISGDEDDVSVADSVDSGGWGSTTVRKINDLLFGIAAKKNRRPILTPLVVNDEATEVVPMLSQEIGDGNHVDTPKVSVTMSKLSAEQPVLLVVEQSTRQPNESVNVSKDSGFDGCHVADEENLTFYIDTKAVFL